VASEHAARLLAAPMEVVGRFTDASNATLLARLTDRDPRPLTALAEALGHEPGIVVDAAMGAGFVPDTVLRDTAPYGPGSVQRFVAHDPEQHYFTLREAALDGRDAALRGRLLLLAVFDLVIDNADRKGGHVLLADDEGSPAHRLRAVDHGVSFNVEDKHRTVIWDLAGGTLEGEAAAALGRLLEALDGGLDARLAALLDPAEVDVTRRRACALLDAGVLPEPAGPNPYPWPLL